MFPTLKRERDFNQDLPCLNLRKAHYPAANSRCSDSVGRRRISADRADVRQRRRRRPYGEGGVGRRRMRSRGAKRRRRHRRIAKATLYSFFSTTPAPQRRWRRTAATCVDSAFELRRSQALFVVMNCESESVPENYMRRWLIERTNESGAKIALIGDEGEGDSQPLSIILFSHFNGVCK